MLMLPRSPFSTSAVVVTTASLLLSGDMQAPSPTTTASTFPSLSTRAISSNFETKDVMAARVCGSCWASGVDCHVAVESSAISLALSLSLCSSRSLPSLGQTIVGVRRLGHSHHRSSAKPSVCFLPLLLCLRQYSPHFS